jgi:anti-sigma regulatory factor (Ser/Thr protein kinase)
VEQLCPSGSLADAVLGEEYSLAVPSRLDWIELVVHRLAARALECGAVPEPRGAHVHLALHEALTNAIIHGNLEISSELKEQGDTAFAEAVAGRCADPRYAGRTVEAKAAYDGRWIHWAFTDEGPGFDVGRVLRRLETDPEAMYRPSGRGVMLMRAFVDEVRWELGGRRVILGLRKGGEEKRARPRHPFQQGVRVTPLGPSRPDGWEGGQAALTRNVSADGLALVQAHLPTTERVLITIPCEGGPVSLPAVVKHWHRLGENAFEVGCRFETGAVGEAGAGDGTAEAVATLVARLAERAAPGRERRAAPRVSYTACIQVQAPAGQGSVTGFARDLSRTGIAFVTTTPLPLTATRLTMPQSDGHPPLCLAARVVRCTRITDGFYDVAVCFVGP